MSKQVSPESQSSLLADATPTNGQQTQKSPAETPAKAKTGSTKRPAGLKPRAQPKDAEDKAEKKAPKAPKPDKQSPSLAPNDKLGVTMAMLGGMIDQRILAALERAKPATEKTPLIFSAMRNVMRDIIPLAKTHEHPDAGFEFRRIDEVCARLQPLLVEHGILYTAEVLKKVEVERPVTTDQGTWVNIFSTVTVGWHIRSAIDGSKWPDPCITIGEGMSEQHFSSNAALTMAEKAFLTKTFCIPVFGAEDPEEIRAERSQTSTPQQVYVTPEAKSPSPGSSPTLFDEIPEAEPSGPSAGTTTPTTTRKKREPKEPQVSSVGGAPLPDQVDQTPAPARQEPLGNFESIIKINLSAKKMSEEELFKHFKVDGFNELYKSQMDEIMSFIQKGPQS